MDKSIIDRNKIESQIDHIDEYLEKQRKNNARLRTKRHRLIKLLNDLDQIELNITEGDYPGDL